MVGAHRKTSTPSAQRGAISDSPAMRGGTQKRSRLNRGGMSAAATPRGAAPGLARGGGRRAPTKIPRRVGRRLDSPATEGGAHRQATVRTRGGAGRRHIARSHPDTLVRREARTGTTSTLSPKKLPRSTPSRWPNCVVPSRGEGGKAPTSTEPRCQQVRGQTSQTCRSWPLHANAEGTLPHRRHACGRTACPATRQDHHASAGCAAAMSRRTPPSLGFTSEQEVRGEGGQTCRPPQPRRSRRRGTWSDRGGGGGRRMPAHRSGHGGAGSAHTRTEEAPPANFVSAASSASELSHRLREREGEDAEG
jgi:hypothetical protein